MHSPRLRKNWSIGVVLEFEFAFCVLFVEGTGGGDVERAGGEEGANSSGTVEKSSWSSSEMLEGVVGLGLAFVGGIGGNELGVPSWEVVGEATVSLFSSSSERTTRSSLRTIGAFCCFLFRRVLAGYLVFPPTAETW